MKRVEMREKVLGEMVVARDAEIVRLLGLLDAAKRLNAQQGDKVVELLGAVRFERMLKAAHVCRS